MRPIQMDAPVPVARSRPLGPTRHEHFGRRAFSRRGFLNGAGVAAVAMAGAAAASPARMLAAPKPYNATPKPIPNGFVVGGQQFHVYIFHRRLQRLRRRCGRAGKRPRDESRRLDGDAALRHRHAVHEGRVCR